MAAHQIQLQLAQFRLGDVNILELAEACIDAINDATLRDDLLNRLPGLIHTRTRIVCQAYTLKPARYCRDLFERKTLTIKFKHKKIEVRG